MSAAADTLVVGTRGSALARAQTQWVIDRLGEAHPGLEVRVKILRTAGDRLRSRPLPEIGGKGLFTAELEEALLAGGIDLAVHSAKDLPTDLGAGLAVLAYPVREDARDAWVSADGTPLARVPAGAVVGTSSLRRQAQLLLYRPDLQFVSLRGNVETRLRRVREGRCAGAVLAMAGLIRADLVEHVTCVLEASVCLPAPGQGALALQGRADDGRVAAWLRPIHDPRTAAAVETERTILGALEAGCRAPVAIHAVWEAAILRCEAVVVDPRGTRAVRARAEEKGDAAMMADPALRPPFPGDAGRAVAQRIVRDLRAGGADEIIAACRQGGQG